MMSAPDYGHSIAWDTRAFCEWVRTSRPGETCVYHAGHLVADRARDKDLASLADTVNLMDELAVVGLRQFRQYLAIVDVWMYIAVRRAGGFPPRSLLSQKINSTDFRALRAIRDRAADISVTRAIRDAISASAISSDDLAVSVLNSLRDRKLVEQAPIKGWQLSAAGLKAMT